MKKVALFLLFLLGFLIIYSFFSKPASYNFSFNKESKEDKEIVAKEKEQVDTRLKAEVNRILEQTEDRFGIYIKNFKNGQFYAENEKEVFEPASLYKVWVMGTVFEKVKNGEFNWNDPIIADVPLLNKRFGFTTDEAELKTGVLNFTVKSAVEQMITISHNYAAYALIEKTGRDNIETFLSRNGLGSSSIGNDTDLKTTAEDLGKLFEKIYKGEVIDPEYSQKMIEVMLKQKRNDRIPKFLPKGTKVAHKTGELSNIRHDGGIVYSPNGDFVIVVLVETKNVTLASDSIAKISEAVYEYFNN